MTNNGADHLSNVTQLELSRPKPFHQRLLKVKRATYHLNRLVIRFAIILSYFA